MNLKQEDCLDLREGVFKNEPDLVSGQTHSRNQHIKIKIKI